MRAWQVQGKGEPAQVLKEVQVDSPVPAPGQFRIAVTAAGLGLPDVLMCRGTYPLTPALPFTPGQEAVGVVTALGDGVDLQLGDRVMGTTLFYTGQGSLAQECLAMPATTFPVPVGLSDIEAAGFWIPNMTAWVGLVDRGQMAAGETLVVLGAAGGSGIAAVQVGRALGARVIAVVSDEQKAAFCKELGADVVVNHTDEPLLDALRQATGGAGVDVVYDPVGGYLGETAASALGRGGRLLCIGFASGSWPQPDTHGLVVANASLVGVFAGGYSHAQLMEMHAGLSALIAEGKLRSTVTDTVSFEGLPGALQKLADRKVIGKLVMLP